ILYPQPTTSSPCIGPLGLYSIETRRPVLRPLNCANVGIIPSFK
ncbi:unnamed protein product, partial [Rotaria magnacalcarata]